MFPVERHIRLQAVSVHMAARVPRQGDIGDVRQRGAMMKEVCAGAIGGGERFPPCPGRQLKRIQSWFRRKPLTVIRSQRSSAGCSIHRASGSLWSELKYRPMLTDSEYAVISSRHDSTSLSRNGRCACTQRDTHLPHAGDGGGSVYGCTGCRFLDASPRRRAPCRALPVRLRQYLAT